MLGIQTYEREQKSETSYTQDIKTKRWRWAGHIARRQNNRFTHNNGVDTENIPGVVGDRVDVGWMDEIRGSQGVIWMRAARDRTRWTNDEEAFLLQWSKIG